MATFREELAALLNQHSRENVSNTPDFVLAQFLTGCLETFDSAILARKTWYGRSTKHGAINADTFVFEDQDGSLVRMKIHNDTTPPAND